ncbi:hypothetical protein, partial [Sphingobacterium daejeonense]|uniref:hypothetical protein n=1 Tax=Sphingobacterium daejeonense TaxID=371142 RepID=UPI003D3207C5
RKESGEIVMLKGKPNDQVEAETIFDNIQRGIGKDSVCFSHRSVAAEEEKTVSWARNVYKRQEHMNWSISFC